MHHHGRGPGHDGLLGTLGCAVLEMGANSTVINCLILELEIFFKIFSSKGVVVS